QSADEPAELVRRLNRVLVESSPSNKFATLFYAELDPQTHRLRYVSGGHNPSLLRVDGEVIELNSTGPIVGLVPKAEFESREVEMPPGSVLVLYTDGVTELMNEEQEEFGTDRLSALLRSGPDGSADEWVERVHEALHDFGGGERFDDDTTLLIVRRLS
ncbi:MAG: PP2C family protein-serine/threonine phosphatase, partial [Acidobacteriota bacterium]